MSECPHSFFNDDGTCRQCAHYDSTMDKESENFGKRAKCEDCVYDVREPDICERCGTVRVQSGPVDPDDPRHIVNSDRDA